MTTTETYRVSVERVVRTLDGNGVERDRDFITVVAFEASPEALLRFAPGEVAAALGAPGAAVTVYPEARKHPLAEVVERAFATAPETPAAGSDAEPAKPTRTRRTKAQKVADDEAQALGFRDAAHRAEAAQQATPDLREPDGTGPTGNGDADLAAAALAEQQASSAVSLPDGPVPQAGAAVPASGPAAPAGTPDAPPAAPWNPFSPN